MLLIVRGARRSWTMKGGGPRRRDPRRAMNGGGDILGCEGMGVVVCRILDKWC